MNGSSFQQLLPQNLSWFLPQHMKTLCLRGFILKPTERAWFLLKNGTRDFQNNPIQNNNQWKFGTFSVL